MHTGQPVLTFWQSRAARGFRSLDLIPIGAGTVLSIQHVVMPAREAMEAGLGSSVRQNRTHLTSTTSVCHPLRIHIVVPLDEASFRHDPALPAACVLSVTTCNAAKRSIGNVVTINAWSRVLAVARRVLQSARMALCAGGNPACAHVLPTGRTICR